MLRALRFATALSICGLLLASAGCRRHRSSRTSVTEAGIFTTDNFPGAPVQNGNVADDRRAMSPAGESFSALDVRFNGDRGTAIVLFYTDALTPGLPEHLYASHYDGEHWTPPVALAAADGMPRQSKFVFNATTAFLNTEDHADEAARERDGDALIAWVGLDADQDGASTADGANTNIYVTGFDASERDNPAANHGFQPLATRLSGRDELGEGTGRPGFVTDGLHGESTFFLGNTSYRNGDPTTGIAVVWVQGESNDPSLPGAEDVALHTRFFNLAQAGDPATPLTPDPELRVPVLGFGASDTGLGSEETLVDAYFKTYDGFLFMRVASDDEPGTDVLMIQDPPTSLTGPMMSYGNPMAADDDITLQVVAFDLAARTLGTPHALLNTPDSTDSNESHGSFLSSRATSIYGPDEGLAHLLVFHVMLANDADAVADFGSQFQDGGLFATCISLATGAPFGSVIIDTEDATIFDTVLPSHVDTAISRNGDAIWVAWLKPGADGASDDLALFAAQFITTRLDEDGSIPDTLPSVSGNFSLALPLSTDIDGFGVSWMMFQGGLGYVCGAQSDPDVVNLFYEHSDAGADHIRQARLSADLAAPAAPVAVVSALESFEEGEMGQSDVVVTGSARKFAAVDAGEGGDTFCVFRRDIDPTAASDFRLFARRTGAGGGVVEIDSATDARQATATRFELVGTPEGEEIGRFDPESGEDSGDRPHPFTRVHVLFHESNTSETSGNGDALRTRTWLADDFESPFADRFHPPLTGTFEEPTEISLPFVDPSLDQEAQVAGVGKEGNAVGVWFREQGHLYYQEYDEDARENGGTGWREDDGVSDPALVDDDAPEELEVPPALPVRWHAPQGCRTLSSAMVFWWKDLDDGQGGFRLQVRVR